LKEYEELERNSPKYNQRRKYRLFSHTLYQTTNETGYTVINIGTANTIYDNAITTFNSIQGATNLLQEMSIEFEFCDKINGLSKPLKNCNKYDDGKCHGACTAIEESSDYNQRVQQAIQKYSINGKNMVIIDKGREIGEHSAILIQDGQLKGIGYYELNHQINNIHILQSIITPMVGDMNTKHIIESHLRKRRVLKILDLQS